MPRRVRRPANVDPASASGCFSHRAERPNLQNPVRSAIRADGSHSQSGLPAPCTGAFSVKLEGGPLDSPLPTAAALGGTLIAGAALISAAFLKGVKP